MIHLNHKNKSLILSLLLFSGITAQSAHATSAYSSSATYDFTISATNTNPNSNSLTNLTIGNTINDFGEIFTPTLDYSPSFTSSSSIGTSTLNDFNNFGTSYTQTFHAEDSISSGNASSEYLGLYIQTFKNTSTNSNDSFDITIDYSYNLSPNVSGQNANTDINIALSNYDYSLDISAQATASTANNSSTPLNSAGSFNFTLGTGEFDILFVDTTITGSIESTAVSAVPVPAAFWLFGTAIIALPSIRKFKAG